MLQEADIGVGISGAEGMQAVMSSDFAKRLLLVHGHWCYRRITMMICYFFYKNIAFGFTLFWFEAYASFSGQLLIMIGTCHSTMFSLARFLLSLLVFLIKMSLHGYASRYKIILYLDLVYTFKIWTFKFHRQKISISISIEYKR